MSRKITRVNFNSTQIQLLNFTHNSLLYNENASLTFDLLGYQKRLSPFSTEPFNWKGINIKPTLGIQNGEIELYLVAQARERSALIREGWVIHNVPVEYIVLVIGHGILKMVGRSSVLLYQ